MTLEEKFNGYESKMKRFSDGIRSYIIIEIQKLNKIQLAKISRSNDRGGRYRR